jgi:hypothetical protein
VGAVTATHRSSPVAASRANTPAGVPSSALWTSEPKITRSSTTTGDDSISRGSLSSPGGPNRYCQRSSPSAARRAYSVLPAPTYTVRSPAMSATAADDTIWPA